MLITAAILAIISIPILLLGLRGRRIDDHPVCRKCRFDLVGVYPNRQVCPECGSGLARGEKAEWIEGSELTPDAEAVPADDSRHTIRPGKTARVRIGNRKRRRVLIALSLFGLLFAASLAGLSTQAIDWDEHKPFVILRYELDWAADSDPTRSRGILYEILGRIRRNELKQERLRPIVDIALRVQANPDTAWSDQWAEVVERYDDAVGLSKEQLFAYHKSGGLVTITPRDSVRIGDEVLVRMEYEPARIGIERTLCLKMKVVSGSIGRAEGVVPIVPPPDSKGPRQSPVTMSAVKTPNGGAMRTNGGFLLALDGHLSEVGTHPLTIKFEYQLLGDWTDEEPLGQWTETHDMTIEVLHRDDSDIALFNPENGLRVEDSVTVDNLALRVGVNTGRRYLIGKITVDTARPLAFKAVAIVGETKIDLGTMSRDWLGSGGSLQFQIYGKDLPDDFDARMLDIELRYDRAPARNRMNIKKIYPLDMLIKDVPIEWPDLAADADK